MDRNLAHLLAKEQRSFLRRDRRDWDNHLSKARSFFEAGLREADPRRPVLILGAGTGLEIPWAAAPGNTTGWDADPWSRLGTALRHRRFPAWVFEDLTGGFRDLGDTIRRALVPPNVLLRRPPDRAAVRLAGLLSFLRPDAQPLRDWIATHQPGTILVANVLGQLGPLAERMVEAAFHPATPWMRDPDRQDVLAEALDAWTGRAISAVIGAIGESGSALWMIHDRAVVHGNTHISLGPMQDSWVNQLQGGAPLEVSDALAGVDLRQLLDQMKEISFDRWIWPVGFAQTHIMESLAYAGHSARVPPAGVQTN